MNTRRVITLVVTRTTDQLVATVAPAVMMIADTSSNAHSAALGRANDISV